MMKPAAALSGAPEVIVVGEALIDAVHTGEGVTEHPGGSPANVAYGPARLDVSSGFLTSTRHGNQRPLRVRSAGKPGQLTTNHDSGPSTAANLPITARSRPFPCLIPNLKRDTSHDGRDHHTP
ncbi:hypothetical protein SRABI83_02937 [Arthrobacter sp. Bi83]|nr:hypothetical protein SRABI83_02937 [Arthrobacter sp. Bi83]